MVKWGFLKRGVARKGVTELDQFSKNISSSLVREVIQNSMDAREDLSKPVRVNFSLHQLDNDMAVEFREIVSLDALKQHFEACGRETALLGSAPISLLVVEDFNTTGLTGEIDCDDHKNFYNFWLAHGDSDKGGKSGGRWGLGKYVFSLSSQIRTFFGLTRRKDDNSAYMMGQCTLANHEIHGNKYEPYGFFSEWKDTDYGEWPVPTQRHTMLEGVMNLLHGSREVPGLTIVIPYIPDTISEEVIAESVAINYAFPILQGELEVEVNVYR